MRIGVIGIGGVGGYFGGKLAREYASTGQHEVVFIARGEHLQAIQQNGLQLYTKEGDYVAWPNIATDQPNVAGVFDVLLFCVKSYALESSARIFLDNITSKTVVIPLLNGIDSAQRLQKIMPHADVISGSVYIISHIEKPGVIHQEGGACKLTFGTDDTLSSQKYGAILNLLTRAKINAVLTDRISQALWTKFLLMCPLASLTAATGKTYGQIWNDAQFMDHARGLMKEVVAVARARQIDLPSSAVDSTLAMIGRFGHDSKTSMQLDREKGRTTEIDTLTAFLCRAGRQAGVATPLHNELLRQLG